MPEALMARTTSPGPAVGSGNSWISNFRSPRKTTPRIMGESSFGRPMTARSRSVSFEGRFRTHRARPRRPDPPASRAGAFTQQLEDAGGCQRHARDADAAVPERVLDGVADGRGGGDDAALAHALDAQLVDRRGEVEVVDLERRHHARARHRVVHEGAGQELAGVVIDQLLAQCRADALSQPAVDLPLHDHRVDGPAAVVRRDVLEEAERARLDVHLERDGVDAEGPGDGAWVVEGAGVEPG